MSQLPWLWKVRGTVEQRGMLLLDRSVVASALFPGTCRAVRCLGGSDGFGLDRCSPERPRQKLPAYRTHRAPTMPHRHLHPPITPDTHPHPPRCHTSTRAQSGTSSRRSSSKRDQHPYAKLHPAARTRHGPSNPCLLDTHHIQILGPKTHILQDKEAPKVRREESRPTRRHIACVFTAAAIAEPRGSHRLLYAQDVRSRVGHMSAV